MLNLFDISDNKKTAINLFTNISAMIVTMAISFFLSPYIVKHLGAEANGFTQLASNFVLYASLITITLNSMAGRFISIEYHRGNFDKAKEYYSSLIAGNVIIILILILPSFIMLFNLQHIINIESVDITEVKLLFCFVFFNFFITQILSILYVSMYVKNMLYIQNTINLIRMLINGLLLITVFSLFNPKVYYVSLIALILSTLILPFALHIKKLIMPEIEYKRTAFSYRSIKTLISAGIWNTVNQGGNILMTGLDLLLANLFISPLEMGLLATAKTIPNAIINVAVSVNVSISPILTKTYALDDDKKMIKQLKTSIKLSSILLSIPIMTFVVLGVDFYSLWMPTLDAQKLTTLSILTVFAYIPFCGTQAVYNIFTTANKLKVNSVSFIIVGFLNLIIVYVLLKTTDLGIFAVAGVSQVLTIIRITVFILPYASKLIGQKWYVFYKDVLISLFCCSICALIAYAAKSIIGINGWASLILVTIVSCIICFVFETYILLNRNERNLFLKVILRRKNG